MNRSRILWTAVLFGIASMPAAAADLGGYYVKAAPSPWYVVNQGPVLSGPSISVAYIGLSRTGVKRHYPFVRPNACLEPRFPSCALDGPAYTE
jgi:hypothetical protein